jgi:hypothetical protein
MPRVAILAANFNQGDRGADTSAGDVAAVDAFATANGLPLPAISNVPEPASAAMMVMAGSGILRRRRRRSSRQPDPKGERLVATDVHP